MEKLIRCFLSVFLLLAVLNFVFAEDAFFGDNGTLELKPRFTGEITGIQWKHNNNLVAEWVKDMVDLVYYAEFKDRTTLNTTTGYLEIRNMSLADSGEYSVEINNRVQPERYNAKLIKAVPKPDVSVNCTAASENCILTCEGNTEEAEPVTYSWKMGEGEWMNGEKDRRITNNETIQSVKTFSCRMKNPISEEESDPKPNPLFREPPFNTAIVVGVLVVGLLLSAGVVVYRLLCKRKYNKVHFFSPRNPENSKNVHGTLGEFIQLKDQDTEGNNENPAVRTE